MQLKSSYDIILSHQIINDSFFSVIIYSVKRNSRKAVHYMYIRADTCAPRN